MGRMLVISDIHGCYRQLNELLGLVGYREGVDTLIFLGDYIDRGMESKEVIEECIRLKETGNVVTLRGNHEDMFMTWLRDEENEEAGLYLGNGGLQTIESYLGRNWIESGLGEGNLDFAREFIKKNYVEHINFIEETELYYEAEGHIFVHAGVEPYLTDWRKSSEETFLWIRHDFIIPEHVHDEVVVFGHTPTVYIHGESENYDIYYGEKKIGIDGACFHSGQLNCLEIKDGEYRQYNTVREGIRC